MWKIVLPGLAMIAVTYALARLSFGLFLPDISHSLGLSESEGGFVGSTAFVSYSIALFLSSYLIKKLGQHKVTMIAGLTAVVGMLGIATAQSFLHLVMSIFVAGIGSGLASPALSQIAKNTLNKKDLDQGNTWINSGTSFGIILTGPVVLLFTEHWRLSYLFFAIIAILVLIWNYYSIPSTNEQKQVIDQKLDWLSIINKAKFLLIASIIIGMSSSIYWTFSRSYLTTEYNMTPNESVVFWIIMGIAGVLGGVAGGFIQKIGLRWSYRLLLFLMTVSIFLLTVPANLTVYISAGLFGSTYIFLTGLFIVWGTRIFNTLPALGVSLSFLALGIGQSLGSFFAGKTIEMTTYPFSFILFAGLGLIGLFVPTDRK
ncbi:MFS transporter [Bacillus sp. JCM 19041]|uniref:MFS transporter n=1 Tax=Bacillus sp. JCM 19041 TaxID=1460637 RepID=UPI0006D07BF3